MNSLRKNVPAHNINTLRNDLFYPFEQAFDSFFNDFFRGTGMIDKVKSNGAYPKIDFFEENNIYILQAAIPGVKPEDVEIEMIDNSTISISGSVHESYIQKECPRVHQYLHELTKRSFTRRLKLGEDIGEPNSAIVKDGILTLKWDKKPEIKEERKLIPIKAE